MSAASICGLVRKSISPENGLQNPYDGIACLSHACMLTSGFKFVGLGEDHNSDKGITSDNVSVLPATWNETSTSTYMFRYSHPQLTKDYNLRVSRLGAKTMIFGGSGEDGKTNTLEVATEKFTTAQRYPWKEGSTTPLADVFVSMSRIKEFASLFASKMSLDASAEGTLAHSELLEGIRSQPLEGRASRQVRAADPSIDPLMDRPRGSNPLEPFNPRLGYDPNWEQPRPNPLPSDWPPDLEDEHNPPGRNSGSFRGMGGMVPIGDDDWRSPGGQDPFGMSRPHRGMYPNPGDFVAPGAGGSLPGLRNQPPAGARYLPTHPGDMNAFGRNRAPGRGGFNPSGGFGGAPRDADDSMFG